jgi:hypothetical protein
MGMLGPLFWKGELQTGQYKAGLNAIVVCVCLKNGPILLDVRAFRGPSTKRKKKDWTLKK